MATGKIKNFHQGETKRITLLCKLGGTAQDITSDTVVLKFKKKKNDTDANAVITATANVAADGANGNALFTLSKTDTDIDPRNYWVGLQWNTSGGDEYVAHMQRVLVKERVADTP